VNSYYPLFLSLNGRKCTVIGGGQVALRKVTVLLKHAANVTVISPRLCAGLRDLADEDRIKVIHRAYQAGDMDGASIAILATSDSAINLVAATEASSKKVLVNVVDNPELSDFIVPSIISRGNLAIAISTGGKCPSLARKIRMKLQKEFGPEYAALALLIAEVRAIIKKQGIKVSSGDWQKAIDLDTMIELIRQDRTQKAREILLARLTKSPGK